MDHMVSIKDVARAAGVSDKTVSRVVNGERNVKLATRQKVERAIQALGYVPNLAARMIRTNRSQVLGVITDVVSTTPSTVDIMRGIQDVSMETGYTVLTLNTSGDPTVEEKCWRALRE
ncbi:MAG: LacI family transcriptional regulator, partial [Alphaproteobacteria bacterium]